MARPIPTRSDEMLDVLPGENGETVVVAARPRGRRGRPLNVVVVEPAAARALARRLLIVAAAVEARPVDVPPHLRGSISPERWAEICAEPAAASFDLDHAAPALDAHPRERGGV